jgi:hypothetical protein
MNSSSLLDKMVGALRKAQELLSGSPEVANSLLPALNVSFFLLDGHGHNFEDYLAAFRGAPLPFLGAFSNPEEFDACLLQEEPRRSRVSATPLATLV